MMWWGRGWGRSTLVGKIGVALLLLRALSKLRTCLFGVQQIKHPCRWQEELLVHVFWILLKREHCTWGCLLICHRCKIVWFGTGENLGQRRPWNRVRSFVLVNTGSRQGSRISGLYMRIKVTINNAMLPNSCYFFYIADFYVNIKKRKLRDNILIGWILNLFYLLLN